MPRPLSENFEGLRPDEGCAGLCVVLVVTPDKLLLEVGAQTNTAA